MSNEKNEQPQTDVAANAENTAQEANVEQQATTTTEVASAETTPTAEHTVTAVTVETKTEESSSSESVVTSTTTAENPTVRTITVKLSGKVEALLTATAGQTLGEILDSAQNPSYKDHTFTNTSGRVVGRDDKLWQNANLSTSVRARGG